VPRVVSLGPIHHDEKKYRLTEEYKLTLADDFIKKSGKCDEELYEMVKKNIKQLREYYDEEVTWKYPDEVLAWILFVDGCATLKFIDIVVSVDNIEKLQEFKIKNDHVAFVQQDLFLLENQLPYQLLDDLMKMSEEEENLRNAILNFINGQSMLENEQPTGKKWTNMATDKDAIHLLDLLRTRLLADQSVEKDVNSFGNAKTPEEEAKKTKLCKKEQSDKKLKDAIPFQDCTSKSRKKKDWQSFRNVQELRAAGIHLESSHNSCLRNITFTKKWNFYPGILKLPPIIVDDSTGPKFFNLIAYEMCPDFDNDYGITSYISFLDSLIDEAQDVIDLRNAKILRNFLGSDEEVALVFNEIGTDLVPNPEIYRDVRSQIQEFYDKKSMTWISKVLHTHFSSPWTVLAFVGALFVLGLTIAQTVYTVIAYIDSKNQNSGQKKNPKAPKPKAKLV
jgi:hypothetical protein